MCAVGGPSHFYTAPSTSNLSPFDPRPIFEADNTQTYTLIPALPIPSQHQMLRPSPPCGDGQPGVSGPTCTMPARTVPSVFVCITSLYKAPCSRRPDLFETAHSASSHWSLCLCLHARSLLKALVHKTKFRGPWNLEGRDACSDFSHKHSACLCLCFCPTLCFVPQTLCSLWVGSTYKDGKDKPPIMRWVSLKRPCSLSQSLYLCLRLSRLSLSCLSI